MWIYGIAKYLKDVFFYRVYYRMDVTGSVFFKDHVWPSIPQFRQFWRAFQKCWGNIRNKYQQYTTNNQESCIELKVCLICSYVGHLILPPWYLFASRMGLMVHLLHDIFHGVGIASSIDNVFIEILECKETHKMLRHCLTLWRLHRSE